MIIGNKVFLRDFRESDIPNMIRWFTIETEWMNWDAPWENDINSFNPEEYRKSALKRLNETDCVDRLKHRLQICINDENEKHIGWVSSYYIDEDYNFTDDEINITIGIAIPDLDSRNKGYATEAWILYINYLLENGNEDVYTETWSGNERVIGLIEKIGFKEIQREVGFRIVDGISYDGLLFKLNIEKFKAL